MTQRDITQADREAALACANEACRNMDGELDFDAMAQAFARHRTEAAKEITTLRNRVAELETAARTAVTYLDDLGLYAEPGHTLVPALQGLKDAIGE